MQRYAARPRPDEEAPTAGIVGLASAYGRYGYRRVTSLLRAAGEPRNWRAGYREIRDADPRMRVLPRLERAGLPDLPVTAVVGTRPDRGERRRREAHVALVRAEMGRHPRGRCVATPGSSHFVPWQEPELVADEVLRVVAQVRDADG